MFSRMNPRNYRSRSDSNQSQSDEDPSRQVGQETYQGDFATMDPTMQVLPLYPPDLLMTLDRG